MHRLARSFLFTFLLQGVMSMLIELPALHKAAAGLAPLRNTVTAFTVLFALALYLAMHFTPRFSKRILLPPILWVFWNALGAFPASLYLNEKTGFIVATAQILLALTLLSRFGDRSGWRWSSLENARQRPVFTWKNLVLSTGFSACMILVLAGLLLHAGAFTVARKTAGFVQIRPAGVFMEERRYQRAGKEIRLVAMIHIAQRSFYEEIAGALPQNRSAAVLLEGVSDNQNLLKKKFGYSNIASALGLTSQSDSTFQKNAKSAAAEPLMDETPADSQHADLPPAARPASPGQETTKAGNEQNITYLQADVDVSVFTPATLRFLEALGDLLGSKSLSAALLLLQNPESPLTDDSKAQLVFGDILDKRNAQLIIEIEKALLAYDTIVVPWGAMHLPVIQEQLGKWDFKETKRFQRKAFSFQKRISGGPPSDKTSKQARAQKGSNRQPSARIAFATPHP